MLAEFDKFIGKLEDEVSDDEIEKYYEDYKDPNFIRADSGIAVGIGEATTTDAPQDAESGAASDTSQPPAATDSAAPADESTPATENGSSDIRALRGSNFRLTAFQQEDQPSDEAAETDTSPDDASSAATATTDESSADASNAAKSTSDTPSLPATADKKPVEYQPLEEVRDQIRRQLAEQKVNDRLRELLGGLESELHAVYTNYLGKVFDAEATGKPVPAPPTELADFAALAEKNGLESGQTGPVSFLELRDLPIGKSVTADENNYRFVLLAFSRELEPYQPVALFDLDGNRYLALKSSDTPGKVPTLDEVRDEVVRAWKMQQAAELALKHAEEVAQKAQASGSWLGDYFANDKNIQVVRSDPFSWLTSGNVSPRTGMAESFRLSQPEGIVAPGPDFMREVFDLKGTNVGAALNHDRTIAYVLRVVEHQDTEQQLRQAFLSEANYWYGLQVMTQSHMQQAGRVLVNDFMDNVYEVDWKRKADEQLREE
jgi:hypothetical protein